MPIVGTITIKPQGCMRNLIEDADFVSLAGE
jgi:hypothetical protein